ncbi:unnamed protein product [Dicrocoelium dendriticum]|nr:unnamed protein product [Dicrocoelium dendriticum]
MLGKIEKEEDYPQLFENTKKAQILTHRVKCIPYECGTLAIEQYQELLFEGPFQLPFSSNISLHNFNYDTLYFKVETSTTNLSVFPRKGAVNENGSTNLIVIRKPLTLTASNAINETITIWESTSNDALGQGYPGQTKLTTIKCVYNTPKTTSSITDCQRSVSDLRNVD